MSNEAADPLYNAMRAAMLACPSGCSCRGIYTGPERRSVARHDVDITDEAGRVSDANEEVEQ